MRTNKATERKLEIGEAKTQAILNTIRKNPFIRSTELAKRQKTSVSIINHYVSRLNRLGIVDRMLLLRNQNVVSLYYVPQETGGTRLIFPTDFVEDLGWEKDDKIHMYSSKHNLLVFQQHRSSHKDHAAFLRFEFPLLSEENKFFINLPANMIVYFQIDPTRIKPGQFALQNDSIHLDIQESLGQLIRLSPPVSPDEAIF